MYYVIILNFTFSTEMVIFSNLLPENSTPILSLNNIPAFVIYYKCIWLLIDCKEE